MAPLTTLTTHALLSDVASPVALFQALLNHQPEQPACLLESSDGDTRLSRYSLLGFSPCEYVVLDTAESGHGNEPVVSVRLTVFKDALQTETTQHITTPKAALYFLKERLERANFSAQLLPDVPFTGGWMGYLGHGATAWFDNIQLPHWPETPRFSVPVAQFALYDTVLVYDHLLRQMRFISHRPAAEAKVLWQQVKTLAQQASLPPLPVSEQFHRQHADADTDSLFQKVTTHWSAHDYIQRVETLKQAVVSGDIFQAVLAHRFSVPLTQPPLTAYRILQAINPSPYAYYLHFPNCTYLGASPERMVSCQNGQVSLRALAGTQPRGLNAAEDAEKEALLKASVKELAEHHMLVDLARNDLGRVCVPGTVETGTVAQVLRYTHVMHLGTDVSGQLRPDKTAYDVLQACFPRGTMSGAPKVRAMELLAQLEAEPRGIYSGAVGYIDATGNMDMAIAIRSALIQNGWGHVHAGAGVVHDSCPQAEYEETRNKAKSILKALLLANL